MRFIAREPFHFANGAIGWRPGGPTDCLGPFAKVEQCPVQGYPDLRVTAYATGYADTFFSVPAEFRIQRNGVRVRVVGFFTSPSDSSSDFPGSIEFILMADQHYKLHSLF